LRLSLTGLARHAQDEYLTGAKYKDILAPNLPSVYKIATVDGYDGGVLPLQRYVELRTMLVESGGTLPSANPRQRDAVLRFLLAGVPDPHFMGALNARYLITDRLHDLWLDDINYDMTFTRVVAPGQRLELAPQRPITATRLGIVSYVADGYDRPQGEQVAHVVVEGDDGQREEFILRIGEHTAQGDLDAPRLEHKPARIASQWRTKPNAYNYLTTFLFQSPHAIRRIQITGLLNEGTLHLRSMSLADHRTGTSDSVIIDRRYSLVASGDVKVYRLETQQPRATIERDFRIEEDEQRALEALRQPGRPLSLNREPVWTARQQPLQTMAPATARQTLTDRVEIVASAPEHLILRAHLSEPGLLYLRETYFPGWRVWIDDQEDEILLANGIFRAVAVPAGSHTVEFRYEPSLLRAGMRISLGSITLVAGLLLLAALTAKRGGEPEGGGNSLFPNVEKPI
jgi:hypothetical protein